MIMALIFVDLLNTENPESNASQPDESLDGSSDVSLPESSRLHQKGILIVFRLF